MTTPSTSTARPAGAYPDFTTMPIAGQWRAGRAGKTAFGGVGASGIGRFGGEWAVREFSTEHWVSVQHEQRSYPV